MAVKVVCDFCDKPLEFEDKGYVVYRTKQLDTRNILPHLCRSCANKLDGIFARLYTPKRIDILEKATELNKARRERLGTKG